MLVGSIDREAELLKPNEGHINFNFLEDFRLVVRYSVDKENLKKYLPDSKKSYPFKDGEEDPESDISEYDVMGMMIEINFYLKDLTRFKVTKFSTDPLRLNLDLFSGSVYAKASPIIETLDGRQFVDWQDIQLEIEDLVQLRNVI